MLSEFYSFLLYVLCFGASAYLTGFAFQTFKRRTLFTKVILFLALAIPVVIAAYRTCGTDTLRYIYNYVSKVKESWGELFEEKTGIFDM